MGNACQTQAAVPLDLDAEELTAIRRAVRVTQWLMLGRNYTTREIAKRLGMTRQGALYLMNVVSLDLHTYQDDAGRWRLSVDADDFSY